MLTIGIGSISVGLIVIVVKVRVYSIRVGCYGYLNGKNKGSNENNFENSLVLKFIWIEKKKIENNFK